MTKQQMIEWIDNASYVELLRKRRFAPIGDPFFQDEVGDHFHKVMKEKRDADPDEHVRASKTIGW